MELYIRFAELDATNEGTDPTFLLWLRNEVGLRGALPGGRPNTRAGEGSTIFLVEWETGLEHQRRFATALASAMFAAPGEEEWRAEVFRSSDGARVLLFGRTDLPADVALLRGRTFAHALAEQVDQAGARMLEARLLEPVESPVP